MTRLAATVHGHVQGVGYRWFVVRQAARLRLTGWVANDPGGTVSVVAEGTDDALDELVRHLERGPAGARVERVDAQRMPATGHYRGFIVRVSSHPGD